VAEPLLLPCIRFTHAFAAKYVHSDDCKEVIGMASYRLTTRKVSTAGPGKYADGQGLWLWVKPSGAKSWVYRFAIDGRESSMGLGSAKEVSLQEAREKAAMARRQAKSGRSPVESRREETRLSDRLPTFENIARELHAIKAQSWRSVNNRPKWMRAIELHCESILNLLVADVGTSEIRRVLDAIWLIRPGTASRLRGQIEAVLDYARVQGHIPDDASNPARWKGHLEYILPKPSKLVRGHHPAIPYAELPDFVATLRGHRAISAVAIEFMILTAARVGEVAGARWDEVDFDLAIWAVPATRMKAGIEHRVPLSPRAVQILRGMQTIRESDFIFSGMKRGRSITTSAINRYLDKMKRPFSLHGMRSTFRDWAGNETDTPREIAEAALAHRVGSAVEQAYRRSDALEKRRRLMHEWATFIDCGFVYV
jgi:integrase